MTQEDLPKGGHFPVRFLTIALALTACVLAWMMFIAYSHYQSARLSKDYNFRTGRSWGDVVYFDEVLASCVRIAAATGDVKWEQRHRIFDAKLGDAVQRVKTLTPWMYNQDLAVRNKAAADKLAGMERQAFDLVREGRRQEAMDLLLSDAYRPEGRIYARGIVPFAHVGDTGLQLQELKGTIVYLDEVLTMSAQMAAATRDLGWERRYRAFEPKLESAIREAMRLAPDACTSLAAAMTNAANIRLVNMEHQAFGLVRRDRSQEALALLFSGQYETQKRIYSQAMARFTAEIDDAAEASMKADDARAFFPIMAMAGAILILLTSWVLVLRSVGNWRASLLDRAVRLRQEIGERRRVEQELLNKNRELEAALSVKSEFLSMVSHELRTPLSVIQGYGDMILQGRYDALPPRAVKPLEVMLRRAKGLGKLVEDLLQLSSLDRGKVRIKREILSVHAHVREILGDLQSLDLSKPTSITLDGEDFQVLADPARFHQILENLIDNAIKYSGDSVEVVIRTRREAERGLIRVSDNGLGIDPNNLPHVFDRFFQAGRVNPRSQKGAGLGLAIVKELVEMMEGTVSAQSELGKGSTFSVSLPLASADGAAPKTE